MEKGLFTEEQIAELRKRASKTKTVDPVSFTERTDELFKALTDDAICQLARAQIKFFSTAAYFYAKHKRGMTIHGWKVMHDE